MSVFEKTRVLPELLAESEGDSSILVTLEVFFDEDMNLNILYEHKDYDYPEYTCYSHALVTNGECFRIASLGDVPLSGVPLLFRKKFGLEVCYSGIRETEDAFYDVLEYIRLSGARYELAENLPYKN